MWKRWKESKFYRKLQQVRVNRAVFLSTVVILLSLAVVLAITAVSNRAKKNEVTPPSDTDNGTVTEPLTPPDTTPEDTDRPTVNENAIPELALPVSGTLTKAHSVDVQVYSQTMNDYRVHLGIDIATAENAPVCTVADGKVSQIWEDPMMGWCIAIEHSGACVTVYKNLAKDMAEGIEVGATVQKGQLLGSVGDSAMMEIAEEAHLHMEMTVKGLQVDPLDYFSAAVLNTLTEDSIYEAGAGK